MMCLRCDNGKIKIRRTGFNWICGVRKMCVALPGTVVKMEEDYAIVDFSGNTVKAFAGFCPVKVGSRVLVHAGCILQVVSQSQAEETEAILRDMEEMFSPIKPSSHAKEGVAAEPFGEKNGPAPFLQTGEKDGMLRTGGEAG